MVEAGRKTVSKIWSLNSVGKMCVSNREEQEIILSKPILGYKLEALGQVEDQEEGSWAGGLVVLVSPRNPEILEGRGRGLAQKWCTGLASFCSWVVVDPCGAVEFGCVGKAECSSCSERHSGSTDDFPTSAVCQGRC